MLLKSVIEPQGGSLHVMGRWGGNGGLGSSAACPRRIIACVLMKVPKKWPTFDSFTSKINSVLWEPVSVLNGSATSAQLNLAIEWEKDKSFIIVVAGATDHYWVVAGMGVALAVANQGLEFVPVGKCPEFYGSDKNAKSLLSFQSSWRKQSPTSFLVFSRERFVSRPASCSHFSHNARQVSKSEYDADSGIWMWGGGSQK